MLLTISYQGENAADLGYLLHKNPNRPQTVDLAVGRAHVFYPEVLPDRCTAALLLDIDPLDLARGKVGSKAGGLFDYVNDRPYVSSSFMSTAISRAYGTALAGRCEKRPDLAEAELDLTANVTMLPCRGDTELLEKIFKPLGYEVSFTTELLDEEFPLWGQSCYVNLCLRGKKRLRDLLRHLYVLIPVFDLRKHYWIGDDEVDKLLVHGEGWLENHPAKALITRRYFNRLQRYTRIALDRMDNGEGGPGDISADAVDPTLAVPFGTEPFVPLNTLRLEAVLKVLKESGARSVLDLGCGEGNLLRLLLKEKCFERIAGADVSGSALERAGERLNQAVSPDSGLPTALPEGQKKRLSLFQSSVTYRDRRFEGYDALALVEVMEHLDENRLDACASVIFSCAAPETVVITTPNREYNKNYPVLGERLRHSDHRFEWNRAQFRTWAEKIAARYGYLFRIEEIGETDEEAGAPTQMGVFTKCIHPVNFNWKQT
ncbi:3' terminal RNA ribose 2'-O-methyltransferase Hen1 [Leadbettera azotonutricia]|uniref:Small RNA 2'-O-methyltransferase n=1 Tax=Leadbettera azotonutricia (strain ATCC BAA-888 / DSM 13862 / ZAS-9) TaxID=545695 RepID=F5YEI1_LEAAZ|nr:3' terminal RNA ribose 2'-O-methyltransferase Hen1 [Leadbettera azotonutricia]AEF82150.1 methyltransferase type 12 [Leadbettera azotonutricia ZAS-9]